MGHYKQTIRQSCFLSPKRKRYHISQKNLEKSLKTKDDHLIDVHFKTPDHPSSTFTHILTFQQSNMPKMKNLIS